MKTKEAGIVWTFQFTVPQVETLKLCLSYAHNDLVRGSAGDLAKMLASYHVKELLDHVKSISG